MADMNDKREEDRISRKTDSPTEDLSDAALIMTGLNQVLFFDFGHINAHGLEMRVYGGPYEGAINLSPMLLRGLSEMAARCADKLELMPAERKSNTDFTDDGEPPTLWMPLP